MDGAGVGRVSGAAAAGVDPLPEEDAEVAVPPGKNDRGSAGGAAVGVAVVDSATGVIGVELGGVDKASAGVGSPAGIRIGA